MSAMDWGQATAAELIAGYLRKWTWPRTAADVELIDVTAELAGLTVAMNGQITACGATIELTALHARTTARLARCLVLLKDISPGVAHIGFMVRDAESLGAALLELAETAGEA